MADMFNKDFPVDAAAELDRRSKFPKEWMYRKYATISIRTTGNTSTIICSDPDFTIGDKVETEGPLSLYTTENNIKKLKPILKSVNITNNGGQDYTDAYLYEIDASFTVFTLEDINRVESSYFRVGAEIEISFGWKGYTDVYNSGKIVAAIYDFSFQMQQDGSYDCSIKAMSAAAIFGSDKLPGDTRTDSLGLSEETTGTDKPFTNYVEAFLLMAKEAFGISADSEKLKITGLGNNEMWIKQFKSKDGSTYTFAGLELEMPSGFFDNLLGGNDTTILYTTLKSLIDYINSNDENTGGGFEILLQSGGGSEYKLSPDAWKSIGSAKPNLVLIPDPVGVNALIPSSITNQLPPAPIAANQRRTSAAAIRRRTAANPRSALYYGDKLKLADAINSIDKNTTDFGKILINISELVSIYTTLYGNQSTAKTAKSTPKISDFLGKVFGMISDATAGITRLQLRPVDVDVNSKTNGIANKENKLKFEIINRSMIPAIKAGNTPYPFKLLEQSSIIRSISLQSNFDSDDLIRATRKSIANGNSPNQRAILSLYSECGSNAVESTGGDDKTVTLNDIKKLKKNMGDDGWDEGKSSTMITTVTKYINQESANVDEGAYSEIPFLLDLSVTIDGINNIPYMAPITIDRLPDRFKSGGEALIEFAITSIEHSFDGQGDWQTKFGTIMRIK